MTINTSSSEEHELQSEEASDEVTKDVNSAEYVGTLGISEMRTEEKDLESMVCETVDATSSKMEVE